MTTEQPTRYIPVDQWNEYHPWPPLGGLRHLVCKHEVKKFTPCFKRIAGRVLIDERAFMKWVEDNHQPKPSAWRGGPHNKKVKKPCETSSDA